MERTTGCMREKVWIIFLSVKCAASISSAGAAHYDCWLDEATAVFNLLIRDQLSV
jgi:hypothetical protein